MAVSLAERRLVLEELSTVAYSDLLALWRTAQTVDSFAEWMADAIPELVDPYASVAADLAAEWYDDSAPGSGFTAAPADLPSVEALRSSTAWALGASGDDALARLGGVTQRAIWNTSRRTIVENATRERGARWSLVAASDACAWCAMMTTRGAVFHSDSSARATGHDHCRCVLRELRPQGDSFEPPDYLDRYEKAYRSASSRASGTDAILSEMRTILGSH